MKTTNRKKSSAGKPKPYPVLKFGLVFALLLLTGTMTYRVLAQTPTNPTIAALPVAPLDASTVCMVNDAYMGAPQIPVEFNGKTYYGCCENCVAKLQNDRSSRYAVDPQTGKEVDKVGAFIVFKPGSKREVLYFESEASYQEFLKVGGSASYKLKQ